MGNVVQMRECVHNYDHLYRHALRGEPQVNVWEELVLVLLWVAAMALAELDLWLFALVGS